MYDPFVGTGSLLVAATIMGAAPFLAFSAIDHEAKSLLLVGATCLGSDIDIRVIRGDGKKGKNIFSPFVQVKLQVVARVCVPVACT